MEEKDKRSNCEECSFVETVERLHEEKKVLEEKLAGERNRLRTVDRLADEADKSKASEGRRDVRRNNIAIYIIVAGIIFAGAFLWQGLMLGRMFRDETAVWNKEGEFYREIRDRDFSRLSSLSGELGKLRAEKREIEGRLEGLIQEKKSLELKRQELAENLEKVKSEAKEKAARDEQNLRANISREYESKIASLKQRADESEKIRSELQATEEALRNIEKEIEVKDAEIVKLNEKNTGLSENIKKTNQSNEYLIRKIDDLQKVRLELEEELRKIKSEQ